jgi:hypothetical protein
VTVNAVRQLLRNGAGKKAVPEGPVRRHEERHRRAVQDLVMVAGRHADFANHRFEDVRISSNAPVGIRKFHHLP